MRKMPLPLGKLKDAYSAAQSFVTERTVIGLDIGSSAAKIVELGHGPQGSEVQTYGAIELPLVHEEKDSGTQKNSRSAAILELLSNIRTRTHRAGISLPGGATFIHSFETAKRDSDQMELILPIEAKEHIPVPVESVSLEWHELGMVARPSEAPKQNVLLIAVRNDARLETEAIATHANLRALFYEVEMFSAKRGVGAYPGETVLLIDFGFSGTRMYLRNANGMPVASYSFGEGGDAFSKKIAGESKLSPQEAELVKKTQGVLRTSHYRGILAAEIAKILWEGMRSANETLSASGKVVERVVFLGGGAMMPGLLDLAKETLNAKIDVASPFSLASVPLVIRDALKEIDPLYAVSMGLALRALQAG